MNNKFFMQQAYEQALLAYSKDEVPIGAIIVKDNKIIAKAHNQTINLQDPTAHAEILALQQASKIIGNHRLINTKLYVTLEPCIMCLGALVQARVNEVYFATTDKKAGLFSKQEFHKSNFLNHHINAYSGIMEQQSSELLKTFFTEKRIKQKNQKLKKYMSNKIVVLYGGDSPEREVSLKSGKAIIQALEALNYDVIAIDSTGKDMVKKIINANPDKCYIALHGEDGENGKIQAILETLNIPHTSSNMKSSIFTMDKLLSKNIWNSLGLNTAKASILNSDLKEAKNFNYPVMIKPTSSGSSIGISKVNSFEELQEAYTLASKFGDVMIEEWITGKEMTVTVLNSETFPSVWIEPKNDYYDYESKYEDGSIYHCPSGLSQEKESKIRDTAFKAYNAIKCSGHARVDFIYSDNKFYIIEINTSPGMTEYSLSPMSAREKGLSFNNFVKKIIEQV